MKTLLEKSDGYKLNINLRDLSFDESIFKFSDIDSIDKEIFFNFVFCCPVESEDTSHYGIKFSEINSISRNNRDSFFTELLSEMDVKSINLFKVFDSEPDKNGSIKERIDLKEKIVNEDSSFLYLYTGASRCEISLFISIRNALAHGNLYKFGDYYYLYSVSSKNAKAISEFDRKINFILRISDIKKLNIAWVVLAKYIKLSR